MEATNSITEWYKKTEIILKERENMPGGRGMRNKNFVLLL